MFLKNHPCHHSSGNAKKYPDGYLFNGKPDPRSCAEKIVRYFEEVLKPNGTALVIHVAWLYKAFWKFATRDDDMCAVNNSKEGLRLMLERGIIIQGMQPHDWLLLANLCDRPIPLKNLFTPARFRADRETQAFITNIQEEVRAGLTTDVVKKQQEIEAAKKSKEKQIEAVTEEVKEPPSLTEQQEVVTEQPSTEPVRKRVKTDGL